MSFFCEFVWQSAVSSASPSSLGGPTPAWTERGRVIPALHGEARAVSSETHQRDAPQLCPRKEDGGGAASLRKPSGWQQRAMHLGNVAAAAPGQPGPLHRGPGTRRAAAPSRDRRGGTRCRRRGASDAHNEAQRGAGSRWLLYADFMASANAWVRSTGVRCTWVQASHTYLHACRSVQL